MFDINYYGANADIPEAAKVPLPDFCHKCGKCCRSATTYFPKHKLQQLAQEGDKEAQEFLEVFTPFESIEEARKVEPEQVDQVMRVVRMRDDMNEADVTFYHCQYVSPEGLCTIHDRRPRFCREAPGHGWSVMPPGCGFEGWQFEQREKHKAMIRSLKTLAYTMEQMSADGVSHPVRPGVTLDDMRAAVEEKIRPWRPFGAEHW